MNDKTNTVTISETPGKKKIKTIVYPTLVEKGPYPTAAEAREALPYRANLLTLTYDKQGWWTMYTLFKSTTTTLPPLEG